METRFFFFLKIHASLWLVFPEIHQVPSSMLPNLNITLNLFFNNISKHTLLLYYLFKLNVVCFKIYNVTLNCHPT